jgi:hypothetical protein
MPFFWLPIRIRPNHGNCSTVLTRLIHEKAFLMFPRGIDRRLCGARSAALSRSTVKRSISLRLSQEALGTASLNACRFAAVRVRRSFNARSTSRCPVWSEPFIWIPLWVRCFFWQSYVRARLFRGGPAIFLPFVHELLDDPHCR